MGKWAESPQTRINTGFFVAIFVFKSGQKVGNWPFFQSKSLKKLKIFSSKVGVARPKVTKSPFFHLKSGQEIILIQSILISKILDYLGYRLFIIWLITDDICFKFSLAFKRFQVGTTAHNHSNFCL